MIYLSEEFMEVERLFRKDAFTKRGNAYYFVTEETEEDVYLCVKLFNEFSDKRFEMEVVEVTVDWEKDEEIIDEVEIGLKEDIEYTLNNFFASMSNVESVQSVMMFEGILEYVKEYFEDAYFYSEGKKIIGEFMEVFEISGVLDEGNYSSTIMLKDVVFKNKMTHEEIVNFDAIYLEGMLDAESEEELQNLLESYAESMSPYDIKTILEKVFQ